MRYPDRIRIDRANRVIADARQVLADTDRLHVGDQVVELAHGLRPLRRRVGVIISFESEGRVARVFWDAKPHRTRWRTLPWGAGSLHFINALMPIASSQTRERDEGLEVKR